MKCTKCGKDLAPIAKFCTNCGAEIVQDINNENTVNTNSFESTIEKNETIDIPKNENVSKTSFFDNLKENWNDKYTIVVIIAVMVVAALLGTVVKNINMKNEFSNTDSYAENEQYISNDTDEQQYIDNNVNGNNNENDNWDSAQDTNENIQDIVGQEEEIENLEVQQYILPGSDTRYLTKEELVGLTAEECRLARNELYARHGRIFTDETLQQYFESFDWYIPTIQPEDFEESFLNEFEIANRDLIVEFEMEQGYR